MPDLNDFYIFESITNNSDTTDGDTSGCFSPIVIIIAIILLVAYFIGNT